MEKIINQAAELFENFKADAVKAAAGNKAAGVRARKAALQIIVALREFRKESVKK